MTNSRERSSWKGCLADENKRVMVFPLAASDGQLALEIENAFDRYFSKIKTANRKKHVFLLSGWLPRPSREQFERIREFGEALKQVPALSLWVISAEKSADDIRRYAPGPLYITGKLISAGIPLFEPEMGRTSIEDALGQMKPEAVRAWLEVLSGIGPGPVDLSHWRHDIRGRILGTINVDLQMTGEDFKQRLLCDSMGTTLGVWSDLVQTRPYCDQHPGVTKAATLLLKTVKDYRANAGYNVAEARKTLCLAANDLEKALDKARDKAHNM